MREPLDGESLRATRQLLGARALSITAADATAIAAWGAVLLEQGLDTPALRVCAGLDDGTSPSEGDGWLVRALTELGEEMPPAPEALSAYAEELAADLLSGRGQVRDIVLMLQRVAVALRFPSRLMPWVHLADAIIDAEQGRAPYHHRDLTPGTLATVAVATARAFLERTPAPHEG
jgi:hypothetical protein